MVFDIGFDYRFCQNASAVQKYIVFLVKENDSAMIMDYFKESVVLMIRLLCWEFEDILHIKINERLDKESLKKSSKKERTQLTDNLKKKKSNY